MHQIITITTIIIYIIIYIYTNIRIIIIKLHGEIMPLKPCALPGCPELVEKGTAYCHIHAAYNRQPTNRKAFERLDEKKSPVTIRFYTSRPWIRTSRLYRKFHPICEECERNNLITPAQMVHHKKKLQDIWKDKENPYSFRFLESLCNNCHLKHLRAYKFPNKKNNNNNKNY